MQYKTSISLFKLFLLALFKIFEMYKPSGYLCLSNGKNTNLICSYFVFSKNEISVKLEKEGFISICGSIFSKIYFV